MAIIIQLVLQQCQKQVARFCGTFYRTLTPLQIGRHDLTRQRWKQKKLPRNEKKNWKLITRQRAARLKQFFWLHLRLPSAASTSMLKLWHAWVKEKNIYEWTNLRYFSRWNWLELTKPRPILLTGSRSANFPRARRLFLNLKQYRNLVHQTIPCKETYFFIDISGAQEQVSKTHSDVNYSVRRKQTQWNEWN